jgi:cytochrome b561
MRISSKVGHAIIDILLLAIPLTATSGAWLEGHPLALPGNVRLGPLDTEAYDVGSTIASIHTLPENAIPCVAVGMQPQPCTTILFCAVACCDPCCRSDRWPNRAR